jgi:hypothetical protein
LLGSIFISIGRPVLRDLIDRPIEIKIEKPSITPIISFSPAGSRDREEIV